MFLANYADGLSNLDLPAPTSTTSCRWAAWRTSSRCGRRRRSTSSTSPTTAPSTRSCRWPSRTSGSTAASSCSAGRSSTTCSPGEDLVEEPFERLHRGRGRCSAYRYGGFWSAMDTFKDKDRLEEMYATGEAPWELWKSNGNGAGQRGGAPPRGLGGSRGPVDARVRAPFLRAIDLDRAVRGRASRRHRDRGGRDDDGAARGEPGPGRALGGALRRGRPCRGGAVRGASASSAAARGVRSRCSSTASRTSRTTVAP